MSYKIRTKFLNLNAQTAIEYMLLMAVVVGLVFVGFKSYIPRIHNASNMFYNRASKGILGDPNPCGDGVQGQFETINSCCVDFGAC